MKRSLLLLSFLSMPVVAQTFSGQLTADDQKYYKNESGAGQNQLERIDSSVKEINKLYAEIASLKSDVAKLKTDVEELKKKK